jgi:hypothetical protein
MANAIFVGLFLIIACLPGCPGFKYLPEQAQGEILLLAADDNNDGDLSTDEICGSSIIEAELADYDWRTTCGTHTFPNRE